MNDHQLKEAWEKLAFERNKIEFQLPNLKMNMELEISKFEKRIKARDRREIIASIALACFFVALALSSDGYERYGSILLIGYFVWIIYYLTKAKSQQPGFSLTKTIKEQLIEYRSYALLQRSLVKNVLYWYILPIIPGVFLVYLSFESTLHIVFSILINLLIFNYVYRLNQRAAKENYEGLLSELDRAIQNLE